MIFWLLLYNFRAKVPIKLNAPDDLLTKHFLLSLDITLTEDYFLDLHRPVLLVDNDENTKLIICRKSFHQREMRCNPSYRRHLLL